MRFDVESRGQLTHARYPHQMSTIDEPPGPVAKCYLAKCYLG